MLVFSTVRNLIMMWRCDMTLAWADRNLNKTMYRVIRWIRTQEQSYCELVLGLMMALKASMCPQDWAKICSKSETLYNWFNNEVGKWSAKRKK